MRHVTRACSFATALAASAVSATEAPRAPREAPIGLSPFIVSTQAETGYAATNTLDGSRLNTALRDTPAAISVSDVADLARCHCATGSRRSATAITVV